MSSPEEFTVTYRFEAIEHPEDPDCITIEARTPANLEAYRATLKGIKAIGGSERARQFLSEALKNTILSPPRGKFNEVRDVQCVGNNVYTGVFFEVNNSAVFAQAFRMEITDNEPEDYMDYLFWSEAKRRLQHESTN